MSEEISSKKPSITMNREIARKIVESAKKTINYDINIMNESGIIIASSDPLRVGSFHEIAFEIINGPTDLLETENTDDLIGTKKGINTVLKYKEFKVGVLGITGTPDEIRPFVRVLKLAVETMIEYELQQQEHFLRFSQQNLLEAGLIYGSTTDIDLLKWATELKLDLAIYRIPIWLHIEENISASKKTALLSLLTTNKHYSAQDIITQWKGNGFVIFKSFACAGQIYGKYRMVISEFLDEFLQRLEEAGISTRAYIGSFSKSLSRYHEAYKRALWVFEKSLQAKERIEYFYDHVGEWTSSFIPLKELHDVYKFFIAQCDEKFIEQMIKTEEALSACNYNFEQASQRLFVHKNTLFLWMNNFRKYFSIDPVKNPVDRSFWKYLCYYCSNRQPRT